MLRPYKEDCRPWRDQAVALAAPTSASTMEWKMTKPSAEPRADSTARSGWGMRPATLRWRLQTPGILWTAPLGFAAVSSETSGGVEREKTLRVFFPSTSVGSSPL